MPFFLPNTLSRKECFHGALYALSLFSTADLLGEKHGGPWYILFFSISLLTQTFMPSSFFHGAEEVLWSTSP
jgi:hypothetical protein